MEQIAPLIKGFRVAEIDWKGDYDELLTAGGAVTLQDWSQVQIAGSDRVKLLHNMCTNDIRRLEPGQMCEAFLLDVKGKIIAHVLVVAGSDDLTLLAVPGQAERIIKHLDRYIIREDAQLADVNGDFAWHLVIGPAANDIEPEFGMAAPCDVLWPGGRLVRTNTHKDSPFGGLRAIDTDSPAWNALRAESFFPLYGIDFDELHLPQEINRDSRAISFTKGCYLGQETVARIDALGHVNKKLVLVKFAGEPTPAVGTKVTAGENEVGTITTSSWSPRFSAPVGIAFVKRGCNDVGAKLSSEVGDAEVIEPATNAS